MEYFPEKREIIIEKEPNNLDRFVLSFTKALENHSDYVIISGYVAILLGRTRGTEDVDLIVPRLDRIKLKAIWDEVLKAGFACVNSSKFEDAYGLLQDHAIRFFSGGNFVPNIEFKMMKNDLDKCSFINRIK